MSAQPDREERFREIVSLDRTLRGATDIDQDTAARGQIVDDADDRAAVALMWDTLKSEALPRVPPGSCWRK